MCTVYVLEGSFEYENSEILGVYTTMERAEAAHQNYLRRLEACTDHSMTRFDEYQIRSAVLDAMAD